MTSAHTANSSKAPPAPCNERQSEPGASGAAAPATPERPRGLPPLHDGPAPLATPAPSLPPLHPTALAPPTALLLATPLGDQRAHKRACISHGAPVCSLRSESFIPARPPTLQRQAAILAPQNAVRRRSGGLPGLPALPQLALWPATEGLRSSAATGAPERPALSASLKRPRPFTATGRRRPRRRRPLGSLLSLSPLTNGAVSGAEGMGEEIEGAAALLQLAAAPVDETWRAAAAAAAPADDEPRAPALHKRTPAAHCSAQPPRSPKGGAEAAAAETAWVQGWWEVRVEWHDVGGGAADARASHGDVQIGRYASVYLAMVRASHLDQTQGAQLFWHTVPKSVHHLEHEQRR